MKSYKFRIYPSKNIEAKLNETLDSCRYLYNFMLEYERYIYEKEIRFVDKFELNYTLTDLKIVNSKLKKIHSQVLQNVNDRVRRSFKAFFNGIKNREVIGYPRFKSSNRYNSFTYPQKGFRFTSNKRINLNKIGIIPIKLHRSIKGEVKTTTIVKTSTQKWFIIFSCEVRTDSISKEGKHVGIDLGLSMFGVLSDGTKINNPKYLKISLGKLKLKSRQLSRKKEGSFNRHKSKLKLAKLYEKISNQRLDFLHRESRRLVNIYSLIAIEDLKVTKIKNKHLQLSIYDASWNKFRQLLTYKAEEAGCKLVCVDSRDTTKECSKCGVMVIKNLCNRLHKCPNCNLIMDRDLNSAHNILNRAYSSITSSTDGYTGSNACGIEGLPSTMNQEVPNLRDNTT